MNSCSFCLEFSLNNSGNLYSEISKQNSPYKSRVLFETNHWVVVPTLGCMVPGYLLIVSKSHFISVSVIPGCAIVELNNIIDLIKVMFKEVYNLNALVFEHGPYSSINKGPSCVDHAHVHIVPFFDVDFDLVFSSEFYQVYNPINFIEMQKIARELKSSYLFVRDYRLKNYLVFGDNIPSQYMRKMIASRIGFPDKWNWVDYVFLDNIYITIDTFKIKFDQCVCNENL